MKKMINRILSKFNYTIKRITPKDKEKYFLSHLDDNLLTRKKMFTHYGITILFDVGANIGQYSLLMRRLGYKERIVSFEPLSSAFSVLQNNAITDHKWDCINVGLGKDVEEKIIHVSENSYSSSLLEILPTHVDYDVQARYVSDERIKIKTLDSIFDRYVSSEDIVMLKIDAQGFEKMILEGAKLSINKILIIQLEMSIEPLYKSETLFLEMINYLNSLDFTLFTFENGIRDANSGKLLQVDGLFINKSLLK